MVLMKFNLFNYVFLKYYAYKNVFVSNNRHIPYSEIQYSCDHE